MRGCRKYKEILLFGYFFLIHFQYFFLLFAIRWNTPSQSLLWNLNFFPLLLLFDAFYIGNCSVNGKSSFLKNRMMGLYVWKVTKHDHHRWLTVVNRHCRVSSPCVSDIRMSGWLLTFQSNKAAESRFVSKLGNLQPANLNTKVITSTAREIELLPFFTIFALLCVQILLLAHIFVRI